MGPNTRFNAVHPEIHHVLKSLDGFLAENPKTCRTFLKEINIEKALQEYEYHLLDKRSEYEQLREYISWLKAGKNLGIISEAGCPGIADPGAPMVAMAHREGIAVVPLIGPSSILMALMASGLNGQSFTFHGYLPINAAEQKKKLDFCIQQMSFGYSQVVMDTPYRNDKLFDALLKQLAADVKLCVAVNITQEDEFIQTKTIAEWKKGKRPQLHKIPCIFAFGQ